MKEEANKRMSYDENIRCGNCKYWTMYMEWYHSMPTGEGDCTKHDNEAEACWVCDKFIRRK